MTIHVDIVTPERLLISDDVDMITLPGLEGRMGILGGHAPLLSALDIGEIILHRGDEAEFIAVGGGVVEVRPDKVTILADVAEWAEDIDVDRAERAREQARQSLEEGTFDENMRPVTLAALRRSNLRLKVAARRRRRRAGPQFEGDPES